MANKHSELTKDLLISKGLEQFYLHGFNNTSLDKIAKSAGLTRGAAYWHFKNKTELFIETIYFSLNKIKIRKQPIYKNANSISFKEQVIQLIDIPKSEYRYYNYLSDIVSIVESSEEFTKVYEDILDSKLILYNFFKNGLVKEFSDISETELNSVSGLLFHYYEAIHLTGIPKEISQYDNRQIIKTNVDLLFSSLTK